MPKVSVIIPTFNSEKTLENTLYSVLRQTLDDIEIICVDDGSRDDTLSLLQSYAQKDQRIKIIPLKENQGTLIARKRGVLASKGNYIMFLDADDLYVQETCQKAYNAIKKFNVDMVQFETDVINNNHLSSNVILDLTEYLKPCMKALKGNLIEYCFSKHVFCGTLWNKIYKGSLCRNAFQFIENSRMLKGEDWYTFFVIAYYSNTYMGIQDQLYKYNIGLGGTGSELTLDKFNQMLTEKHTYDGFCRFLKDKKDAKQYADSMKFLYEHFIDDCTLLWSNELREELKPKAYKNLIDTWGEGEVLSRLANYFWDNHYNLVSSFKESQYYNVRKRTSSKRLVIAFYYWKIANGGAERVTVMLCNRFAAQKNPDGTPRYKVILVTDDKALDDEYELSKFVDREFVPSFTKVRGQLYKKRFDAWRNIIVKWDVDLVVSGLWVDPCTFWDMLAIKGAPSKPAFIIHSHSFCAVPFLFPNNEAKELIGKYELCDGVVALSKVDERYISAFNSNAHYIVNPIAIVPEKVPNSFHKKNTIVWVGRISYEKNPLDAILMMQMLVKEIPEAKLYIIGDGDKEIIKQIKTKINNFHLEQNIILEGFQLDVGKYYNMASVFINTSSFEGFSLTISEAMSYAVPIITYDLPWLTFIRNVDGIISIPQRRYDLMAEQVAKLLKDNANIKYLGEKVKKQIINISNEDILEEWKNVFDHIFLSKKANKMNSIAESDYINENILLRYITFWQDEGRTEMVQRNWNDQQQQIVRLHFDLDSVHQSVSFRVGRALTWGPRKIRGGMWCLQDHGLAYTIKRIIEHIGIDMGTGDFKK